MAYIFAPQVNEVPPTPHPQMHRSSQTGNEVKEAEKKLFQVNKRKLQVLFYATSYLLKCRVIQKRKSCMLCPEKNVLYPNGAEKKLSGVRGERMQQHMGARERESKGVRQSLWCSIARLNRDKPVGPN